MSSSFSSIPSSVTMKLYFTLPNGKEEIRRFTTSALPVMDALLHFLDTTYSKFYQPPLRFLIQYDDDDDRITISSEVELQEGFALHTAAHGDAAPWKLRCRFDDDASLSGLATPSGHMSVAVTCPPSPSLASIQVLESAIEPSQALPVMDEPSPTSSHRSDESDDSNLVDAAGALSEDEYIRIEDEVVAPPTPIADACASLSAFIDQRASDRFACRLCPKMFKGESFLVEHLRNKHADAIRTTPTIVASPSNLVSTADAPLNVTPSSVEFSTQTTASTPLSVQDTNSTQTESSVSESIATQTVAADQPSMVEESDNEPTPQVEIDDVTGHHDHCEPSPVAEVSRAHDTSLSSSSVVDVDAEAVHTGIACDGCGTSPIIGIRYHCTSCTVTGGYDLCASCESRGDCHPRAHVLLKMRRPANIPIGTAQRHLYSSAQGSASASENRPRAKFLSDVTLADGLEVHAGEVLQKVWSVQNSGPTAWPIGTRIVFAGGDLAPESDSVTDPFGAAVPFAGPGDVVHLSIAIQVPQEAGRFRGTFRLETPQRVRFGPRIWIDVVVPEKEKAEPEQPAKATPAPAAVPVAEPVAPVSAPSVPAPAASAESLLASEFAASHLDSASSVQSQVPTFQYSNQFATLRAMGFGVGGDAELCRYLLLNNQGDVQKVVAWLLANC